MRYPPAARAIVVFAALASLSACVTLLGDFSVSDTAASSSVAANTGASGGSGGSGAAGGMGGSGGMGGMGGMGGSGGMGWAADYGCVWEQSQHTEVVLESDPSAQFSRVKAEAVGSNDARALINSLNGVYAAVTIYDDAPPELSSGFAAGKIFSFTRGAATRTVAVYDDDDPTSNSVFARVFTDGNASTTTVVLADETNMTGIDPGQGAYVTVATVPSGSVDSVHLDLFLVYPSGGVQGLYYGRYQGTETPPLTKISAADITVFNSLIIREAFHVAGTTYAFAGQGGEAVVVYEVGPSTNGVVTPRSFDTGGQTVVGAARIDDSANVVVLDQTNGFRFFVDNVAEVDLGTFSTSDLTLADTFLDFSDLPVFEGEYEWRRDMFVAVGTEGEGLKMSYYIIDNTGVRRALGTLPFQGVLEAGQVRNSVTGASATPIDGGLEAAGGRYHVIWTEAHDLDSSDASVAYHDILSCTPN